MPTTRRLFLLFLLLPVCFAAACAVRGGSAPAPRASSLRVHYLEIVTPSVDATCAVLAQANGVPFGAPVAELGNARTAVLGDGRVGVRAPMRADEAPVVRPYLLVPDVAATLRAAEAAGAQVALGPTPIPGQGTIAIYVLGGIDHGLWQL